MLPLKSKVTSLLFFRFDFGCIHVVSEAADSDGLEGFDARITLSQPIFHARAGYEYRFGVFE